MLNIRPVYTRFLSASRFSFFFCHGRDFIIVHAPLVGFFVAFGSRLLCLAQPALSSVFGLQTVLRRVAVSRAICLFDSGYAPESCCFGTRWLLAVDFVCREQACSRHRSSLPMPQVSGS